MSDIAIVVIQVAVFVGLRYISPRIVEFLLPIDQLSQEVRLPTKQNESATKDNLKSYFQKLKYKPVNRTNDKFSASKPLPKSRLSGIQTVAEVTYFQPENDENTVRVEFTYNTQSYRLNPFFRPYCVALTNFHQENMLKNEVTPKPGYELNQIEKKLRRYDLATAVILALIGFPVAIVMLGIFGTVFQSSNPLLLVVAIGFVGIYTPTVLSWYGSNWLMRKIMT